MNLDKIVGLAVNSPKIDGVPLYTRVDNQYEERRTDKWVKASENNYNSPNNIRRLFITGEKVYIQFYKPPIRSGKADTRGNWVEIALKEDLNSVVKNTVEHSENMRRYYMERAINPEAKEPEIERVQGWGLKVMSSPWVISNVEEIYFDFSLLISEDIRGAVSGAEELFKGWLSKKSGLVKTPVPTEIFHIANNTRPDDFRKKYPRLKMLAMISKLKDIMENGGTRDFKEELWVKNEVNVNLIKQSGSLLVLNEIGEDIKGYNTKFHCREGIYKFDREVLQYFIEDYINKRKVSNSIKAESEESIRLEKSEFEGYLDILLKAEGESMVLKSLALGFNGAAKDEVNKIFSEMSSEGEYRYRKIIGMEVK